MTESPQPRTVDEAFEAHIAPVREALRALLEASDQLRETWGSLPATDSKGVAELAAEGEFQGTSPWGVDPVAAAHNSAQLLLFAMGDCMSALIRELSDRDTTPVYAHVVLARASLELASRAWWLLDPDIGVRTRIARGMNDRIFGLKQQIRLPLPDEQKEKASKRRSALLAEAERLGFQMVPRPPKAPQFIDEMRPGQTELIERLLSVEGDDSLGGFVYGLFSAVAHGTTFGMSSSVTTDAPNPPKTPGITWGAVYTGSLDVVIALSVVIVGSTEAYRSRNKLFGWASKSWNEVVLAAIDAMKRSLPPPQSQ